MPELAGSLLHRCLSVDLEVDPKTARIFALAAVWPVTRPTIVVRGRDMEPALDRLETASADVDHLIGHNILRQDLPHLVAARPRFSVLLRSSLGTVEAPYVRDDLAEARASSRQVL
ncbi:hypothetical protein [Paracoccus benzoatiresistens]|uniref:Uncharacterized protein n=1 Tax=Paracoccus benzoatiresistens TaxID=2997341 RepID=A0ABT4J722_9RHOB|nr:hypothetical protein [Paracoccus sp. EF6]MCZ0962465.1 hypothetical protein [Paracoccus sp. EF6]